MELAGVLLSGRTVRDDIWSVRGRPGVEARPQEDGVRVHLVRLRVRALSAQQEQEAKNVQDHPQSGNLEGVYLKGGSLLHLARNV